MRKRLDSIRSTHSHSQPGPAFCRWRRSTTGRWGGANAIGPAPAP